MWVIVSSTIDGKGSATTEIQEGVGVNTEEEVNKDVA